ncbi:MAG: DNA primase [Bacillota bacterium]
MGVIRYSDDLVEEIRINNDIVDVVAEYVRLEKRGKNYFGLCPFHREKTPSFSVEPTKQIFYCFGCGKGGNVFHFISLIENIDYMESIKLLADRAKIVLPETNDEAGAEIARKKQQVMRVNLLAAKYFNEILIKKKNESALNYLKKRGITEQTAMKFGIGYSEEDSEGLYRYLKANGANDELMMQSGIFVKGRDGCLLNRFRGRLMFPIFDVVGSVIGFGGRVLDDSVPKYINSPETIVYNKRNHLYALNFAKNTGISRLVVVEGYMDVISLYQEGINNAVASLGTSLTERQGRLLKKYADEIVISYDADTAGQAATLRGLELLDRIGCNVRVVVIPDGKDPDEYVRKNGAGGFNKLVENSMPLVDYKIRLLRSKHDLASPEGRLAFLNKAADVLAKINNSIEREMYIKKLSGEYEISEEAMLSEVLRRTGSEERKDAAARINKIAVKKSSEPGDDIEKKILHGERFIISLLCTDNSIYNTVKEHFNVDKFIGEENRRIAGIIYKKLDERKEFSPAELMDIVSGEETGEFARILRDECHCDDNRSAIWGKIKDMEILKTEMRRKQVLELLKDKSGLSEGDVKSLMQELKGLTNKLKDIKNNKI